MSIFKKLPNKETLLKQNESKEVLNVNAHFHTPYSFSAFEDLPQVFKMAEKENISVLGINDFNTTDGYLKFHDLCVEHKKFPLFCIEFMALQHDEKAAGVRVNDPNNPGRTYFCGKGLNNPPIFDKEQFDLLDQVYVEGAKQTKEMVNKLNVLLKDIGAPFTIDYETVKKNYCRQIVRERHIAKALRVEVMSFFKEGKQQITFFTKLFSGKSPAAQMHDIPTLENEIRGKLLKAGGPAFVEENDKAFLSLEEVIDIVTNVGGIPCYPTLLDNNKGEYTDFEGDFEKLFQKLTTKNIWALELIPGRNKFENLKKFVQFFNEKGFIITFGTEHNTPALDPLTVTCSGGVELDEELKKINYEGACVYAANQYLYAKGKEGYLDASGKPKTNQKTEFVELGNAVIKKTIQ